MLRALVVATHVFLSAPVIATEATDHPYLPGYRYYQAWIEDSRIVGATGIDVSWAAIHARGFEVDLGTGLRVLVRHQDAYVLPAWTASMALTLPKATAPYLEVGFDMGEALTRNVLDSVVKNSTGHVYVKPDAWVATGIRTTLSQNWALKGYYKQHFIEGEIYRDLQREVWGIALVLRIPRKQLLWWQLPL